MSRGHDSRVRLPCPEPFPIGDTRAGRIQTALLSKSTICPPRASRSRRLAIDASPRDCFLVVSEASEQPE